MKNAFAHNAFAASGGISQTAADARYVLKAAGSFTGLTGAGFRDTSAAFDVTMSFASSTALDAGRSITWDVKNADHQLKFTAASIVTFPSGTVTLAQLGANTFTGQQVVPAGSQAAPALAIGAVDSGIYSGGPSRIDLALGGASKHTFWSDGSYYQNDTAAELLIANRVSLCGRASNHLGIGAASATPVSQSLGGAQGSGTNITGGDLNIGTQGTGTGTGGIINFQSHAAGASGSTLGTLVTVASTLSDRFKVASGMLLQIGNAAATEALVCDKSIQFLDSTGTAYKVPCVAA
jgi:hypothetical protein